MSTSVLSKFPNQNDVQGAAFALAVWNIMHPEDDVEYGDTASQTMEDYCPLLRVPDDVLTPEEREMVGEMDEAIQSEASRIEKELLSSEDPTIQALIERQPTKAE